MYGQTTYSDPHQDIVDRYLAENNPYVPSKSLKINLRKYLQYAEEHNLKEPSSIPDEILDTFMLPEKDPASAV